MGEKWGSVERASDEAKDTAGKRENEDPQGCLTPKPVCYWSEIQGLVIMPEIY